MTEYTETTDPRSVDDGSGYLTGDGSGRGDAGGFGFETGDGSGYGTEGLLESGGYGLSPGYNGSGHGADAGPEDGYGCGDYTGDGEETREVF